VRAVAARTASEVGAQIIQRAQYVRQNGRSTVRMQLNPPEMGRIRLAVEMRAGRLEVRMRVENPAVRQAMSRERDNLDRTLRDAQVDVQRFEVTDYQGGRRGPDRQAAPEGGPVGSPAEEAHLSAHDDPSAGGWARISESGAVDCLI